MPSTQTKAGTNPQLMFQALIPGFPQKVTISGSSDRSGAFQAGCSVIRFFPTVDCYVAFGASPTATTDDIFCPGGIIQYFGVNPSDEIAVIQAGADSGILHIVEGLVNS